MKILKRWYFEWLDRKVFPAVDMCIRQEIRTRLNQERSEDFIRYWIEHYSKDCVSYTDFISACANNVYLVDAIVESINRKQIK